MNYNRENVDESYKNNVEQEKLSTNLHTWLFQLHKVVKSWNL